MKQAWNLQFEILMMKGAMSNNTTISLFVPTYRFFSQINKTLETNLLFLKDHGLSESHSERDVCKMFLSLKMSYPLASVFLNQGNGYPLSSQQLYGSLFVFDSYVVNIANTVRYTCRMNAVFRHM
jgi:hypothetical protein